MAIKSFPILLALLAILLVSQIVSCEEENIPSDTLFIESPDTDPAVIDARSALKDFSASPKARCTDSVCNRNCRSRGYRYGRCNASRTRCLCWI
ncbi:unnamed protein product [Euphydryas editha]|uniref:Defensin n=1 Tax=Euphydryas editha TaxID=104508 RepID=A0AAU9TZB9_EUPED|nr:unnamed protein product [Euphydryas editha]CAH2091724.1 unnamed protein product [Euphydryas editha]